MKRQDLKNDQIVKVRIAGDVVRCRVLGPVDPDPACDIWVVKLADPDNAWIVGFSQILEITGETI